LGLGAIDSNSIKKSPSLNNLSEQSSIKQAFQLRFDRRQLSIKHLPKSPRALFDREFRGSSEDTLKHDMKDKHAKGVLFESGSSSPALNTSGTSAAPPTRIHSAVLPDGVKSLDELWSTHSSYKSKPLPNPNQTPPKWIFARKDSLSLPRLSESSALNEEFAKFGMLLQQLVSTVATPRPMERDTQVKQMQMDNHVVTLHTNSAVESVVIEKDDTELKALREQIATLNSVHESSLKRIEILKSMVTTLKLNLVQSKKESQLHLEETKKLHDTINNLQKQLCSQCTQNLPQTNAESK